ncbi:DUF4249 domain-containing protein [Bacteroidales bacterium]|nr:DUF4249 domain-containing protein [Bacteroidales bacterium]
MNILYKILFFVASSFVLFACEEVIEIDLNSSNPVIVAEALVERDSVAWIQLSYSSDYFDNKESEAIEDVTVMFEHGDSVSEYFIHLGNGLYKGNIAAVAEQQYTLSFSIGGISYVANTTIMNPGKIVDIKFEESGRPNQNENNSFAPTVIIEDEKGCHNRYMVKFWSNGELKNDRYYLVDDKNYADNGIIEYTTMGLTIEEGNEIKAILYTIDENTYSYYSQLNDIGGGGGMRSSSTPYNPQSNFGDDIMGYFAGWSKNEFTTTVFLNK